MNRKEHLQDKLKLVQNLYELVWSKNIDKESLAILLGEIAVSTQKELENEDKNE